MRPLTTPRSISAAPPRVHGRQAMTPNSTLHRPQGVAARSAASGDVPAPTTLGRTTSRQTSRFRRTARAAVRPETTRAPPLQHRQQRTRPCPSARRSRTRAHPAAPGSRRAPTTRGRKTARQTIRSRRTARAAVRAETRAPSPPHRQQRTAPYPAPCRTRARAYPAAPGSRRARTTPPQTTAPPASRPCRAVRAVALAKATTALPPIQRRLGTAPYPSRRPRDPAGVALAASGGLRTPTIHGMTTRPTSPPVRGVRAAGLAGSGRLQEPRIRGTSLKTCNRPSRGVLVAVAAEYALQGLWIPGVMRPTTRGSRVVADVLLGAGELGRLWTRGEMLRAMRRLDRVVAGVVLGESGEPRELWTLGVTRTRTRGSRTVLVAVRASEEMREPAIVGLLRRHLRLMRSRPRVRTGAVGRALTPSSRRWRRTAWHLTADNGRRLGLRQARN